MMMKAAKLGWAGAGAGQEQARGKAKAGKQGSSAGPTMPTMRPLVDGIIA